MKNIHLICNAHLDPVWLWRWEEGCTEALSTFRTAAKLTGEYPGFVFNHNESVLYQWVKDNEPELFEEIRQQVAAGTWHIMGGWYIQPDCNMPSGESFVRNILKGRSFFQEEFGTAPTTAINFDSFGHTRGLVQILKQAGYDSYLVCRPAKHGFPFEEQDFCWEGLDGSQITVHRSDENYNSIWGQAAQELMTFLPTKSSEGVTLCLWGVGDHGGGPSRKDLTDFEALISGKSGTTDGLNILHSTPEAYFRELHASGVPLPHVAQGLNPVAPGCYTSQIRVKQKHRLLENELYATEKMATAALLSNLKTYDPRPLKTAEQDLLFSEFHDALPGSGSQLVEEDTLRQLDHGLQELSQEKLKIFLALAAGQEPVEEDTSAVLVYNPHPFPVSGITEIEFGTPKQNWDGDFLYPTVHINGVPVPTQYEKETSNFGIDWRKKAAVLATLPPSTMTRMDVHFHRIPKRPTYEALPVHTPYLFDNGEMQVVINTGTGLVDRYAVHGHEYCRPGSFQLMVQNDTFNSWGIAPCDLTGRNAFALLSPHEGSAFSGLLDKVAPSVRIIEDGPVRTVVEALFGYHHSYAWQRYLLPKQGTAFEVETGVYWNEKDQYLKLRIDTPLSNAAYWGQIAFGREQLQGAGEEVVAQKWVVLREGGHAFTVINAGSYGSNAVNGSLGLTLLRSAGFSAGDCAEKALQEIRHEVRMEQGERLFRFRIQAGEDATLMDAVDAVALAYNEKPYAIAYCPSGRGTKPAPAITLDNPGIMLSCMKQAEDGKDVILRLYECQGKAQETHIQIMGGDLCETLQFAPFEIRTFRLDPIQGTLQPEALLEGGCSDRSV